MGGAQTDLTNLEFIYFWIASIIAHASPPVGTDSNGGLSPRIFIVGTHRDSLPGSEAEKQAQVHHMGHMSRLVLILKSKTVIQYFIFDLIYPFRIFILYTCFTGV